MPFIVGDSLTGNRIRGMAGGLPNSTSGLKATVVRRTVNSDSIAMIIAEDISSLTASLESVHPVVLVPTMGALHRGHAALLEEGRLLAGEDGILVASIFVNPTQFGPNEDFEAYPRTMDEDLETCAAAKVDVVFAPSVDAMYPGTPSTKISESSLSGGLCGASRPGHFDGVCTVVTKLFNIVRPDIAVFGKKDYQQLAVIRRFVRDLNLPVKIVGVETVREDDGLALSSRNTYLSADQRREGAAIRRALVAARDAWAAGTQDAEALKTLVAQSLRREAPTGRIDYLEVVDQESLQPLNRVENNGLIAGAVFFGKTRLIDNIELSA